MNELNYNIFLPQNYIAEEILLGILLIYPKTISYIIDKIKKEYFFLESHQIFYINIIEIYNHNKENNIIELFHKLNKNQLLHKIGGYSKILKMMKQSQIFILSSDIDYYIIKLVQILHDKYIKRLIIQYGYQIIKLANNSNINNFYLYNKILSYLKLTEIENNYNNNLINLRDLISIKISEIKYQNILVKNTFLNNGLKSGLKDLDNIISNLPNGNLIIIAGRPSIGKTSLAINIAYNIFFNENISISIFSLEMSSKEILHKFISIALKTYIQPTSIHKLNHKQWKSLQIICNKLLENNIYINDEQNININYIEKTAKSLKKKNEKISLIIIDYLQLIELNEQSIYNRSQELGYITRKLKLLAQILNLPIIVLSQLNRNIEIRSNKEPVLSDLRESGCLNQLINVDLKINKNSNLHNAIHIRNITYYLYKLTNKKNLIQRKIYFFQQYTFNCHNKNQFVSLTHNHKYLLGCKWIKTSKITSHTTIDIKNNKQYIKKIYFEKIQFNNYSSVYDINQGNFFYIISKNVILHNSIEQDADIIIMLYEKKEYLKQDDIEIKNINKILDVKISKNRNGYTGQCQIMFIPKTAIFTNISNIDLI
uniref:DNA 5'-3' helicase n=1 Tax=Lophocladia kuetzingii TaxID=675577 RepID=A0A1Z1MNS1_9FLOR|nr:Replication helicase subunit [Lophocladia kuetzingii]ARW67740.1 Replication helicase subunit [Lophocladia kuetzingii]